MNCQKFQLNEEEYSLFKMRSVCISEVFLLLLCVVELLETATSVSEFCCAQRNLSVTVDDTMRLYIDGDEITRLPNARIWKKATVVDLPCTTRLIAIHGRNGDASHNAGILASTDDEYVLTNSTWKCSNISQLGWEGIGFDDSDWLSAVECDRNGSVWPVIPGISSTASWMWLNETSGKVLDAFCRKRLDYDCICCHECLANNNGSQRREALTTATPNDSNSSTIFAVFFGVSVLANVVLISALCVLHSRKKREKGRSGVNDQTCRY